VWIFKEKIQIPQVGFGSKHTQMANGLWNDFDAHGKLNLANWRLVCTNKEFGGLGILDLANVNICLLGYWIKRHSRDDGKL
jgi:hypothetical protein